MAVEGDVYAARLDVDYPEELDRTTTLLRIIWIIPIAIIIGLMGVGEAARLSLTTRAV